MHRVRISAYSLAFFAAGYALALPGATLAFIGASSGASEGALGVVFVVRGAVYCAASLGGGFLGGAARVGGTARGAHRLMGASLVLASAGLAAAEAAGSAAALGGALACASLAMGALDTLGNLAILRSAAGARGGGANRGMALAHSAFGLGCACAPGAARSLGAHGAYRGGALALVAAGCAVLSTPGVALAGGAPAGGAGGRAAPAGAVAVVAACAGFALYVGAEQACGALVAAASGLPRAGALACASYFWFGLLGSRALGALAPERSVGQCWNQSPVDGRPGISSNPSTSLKSNSFSMILEPWIQSFPSSRRLKKKNWGNSFRKHSS